MVAPRASNRFRKKEPVVAQTAGVYQWLRPVAQPQLEDRFLAEGVLTAKHIANRKILREAMMAGGYTQLPHEWWHFDALPKAEVRSQYQIVE